MSVDIFSKENKTELKDRDLASLQQEKGTQVLHSLAQRNEREKNRKRRVHWLKEILHGEMLKRCRDDEGLFSIRIWVLRASEV